MTPSSSITADVERGGWRELLIDGLRSGSTKSMVLSGSIVMLIGTVLVSVMNFAFNVAMARMLGPREFGHATAAVTLLMLASAITLSFQLVCAKFVARNETAGGRSLVFHTLLRRAWMVGVALALAMALSRNLVSEYLRLPDSRILLLLAVAFAFYVPLGVKRGGLQGGCAFPQLSFNFVVEAFVKLAVAVLLVNLGYQVMGAVGALAISVTAAYLLAFTHKRFLPGDARTSTPASFREGMQAIVFFVGQVIISNVDIILVKHFFSPVDAGLYAAVALVGRVLFYASWSVVSAMFPISAAEGSAGEGKSVLLVPLGLVFAMSTVFVVLLSVFSGLIIKTLFGAHFAEAESLLGLYAASTGIYAIAVVLMTYEMSRKIANTGWLQLFFSGILAVAISFFHGSLREVVHVQIGMMITLLLVVTVPFLRSYRQRPRLQHQEAA